MTGLNNQGRGFESVGRGFRAGRKKKIIDNWEDNDLSEYSSNSNGGSATVQTGTVYDGSYAMQIDTDGAGQDIWYSTSGLNYYPEQGDIWERRLYTTGGGDVCAHGFGLQDLNNVYKSEWRNNDAYKLTKISGGSGSVLTSTTVGSPTGEWLREKLEWASDGTITVTMIDSAGTQLAQLSATDTEFASGGVSWEMDNHNSNSSTSYIDFARTI